MSGPLRDLVHAWRGLKRNPGFMLACLATLALGIGANVTIFSVVNGLEFRPMPFGDRSDRLVTVHPTHRLLTEEPGWGDAEISYRDLLDFRAAPSVEGIGAYLSRAFVLSGDAATAERIRGGSVTPDLFRLLGIDPILGRHFLPEEGTAPGLEASVMLTYQLWQRRFGGDPSIVGKTIIVNDRARMVVGVLPPGFQFPEWDQMYAPLRWDESPRSARYVNAVALMRPGATIDETRAQIGGIARRLEELYPETNRGYGVQVVPIRKTYVDADTDAISLVLTAAVGFVLLIVCANLANLMLVRGAARQRELAVRAAMGAGRGRLVWASLCESLMLAVPGGALGLLASQWALDAMRNAFGDRLSYWVRFDIDLRVTLFTIGATLFTAIAVGLIPSLRAARLDLAHDLKEAGRGLSLGRGGQRLQATLAVAQVALCFGLLVGANMMVRSFIAMQTADLGFDDRPILSAHGFLAGDAYNDIRARSAFYTEATARLAALPGVVAAAATTSIPGDDGGSKNKLVIDGRVSEDDQIMIEAVAITPDLFNVLGVPVTDGRSFTASETNDPRASVAVLNQSLANKLWPLDRAVDKRIGIVRDQEIEWFQVVGVVPDVHYEEIGEETAQSRLNVYLPYAKDGARSMALLVRSAGSPEALVTSVRDTLHRLSASFPVDRLTTMSELRVLTTWERQFFGNLVAVFAAMALALACLGIYGLISYSVGRRAREIGVRLALGARPGDVIAMLLRESAKVGVTGLAIGLIFGVIIARLLSTTLYGVAPDGWLFASMAAPLTLALFAATWWPARRAARMEPTVALRDE